MNRRSFIEGVAAVFAMILMPFKARARATVGYSNKKIPYYEDYKTVCENKKLVRYRRIPGRDWVFDSVVGCCECSGCKK